ncbi:uncharacterized protein BO80DRAFT_101277 [Aspergillus ibericus CBS 121593]|uniref:Uncharacterized protein n=1 Tax=Aspergillus ibericus CBS 121593 TaxID=1448316 RepID=A0A395GYA2_9EURO|nr:hypothetical protein BO80DRAFT_101277 [Aspergillus ibericus CBS 121593]RAL00526.1 hypothetical protein BO80DRAFT_101277 [Aspergillus ibericus CBS 121593]
MERGREWRGPGLWRRKAFNGGGTQQPAVTVRASRHMPRASGHLASTLVVLSLTLSPSSYLLVMHCYY